MEEVSSQVTTKKPFWSHRPHLLAIFGLHSGAATNVITLTELLLFVSDFAKDRESVVPELNQIEALAALPEEQQNVAAEQIYSRLERKLTPDPYSVEELRAQIAARFDVHRLHAPFTIVFLPEGQQEMRRLELKVDALVRKMLPSFGRPRMEKVVIEKTYASILEGAILDVNGHVNFSKAERRFLRLPPTWLKLVEKSLNAFIEDLEELLRAEKKSIIPLTDAAQSMLQKLGMAKLSKEGGFENVAMQLLVKSKKNVPVVVSASALRGADGTILGAVITAKDMSKIRQLEAEKRKAAMTLLERMEEEKNKLESTLESIGDGAFVVNEKEEITFFNRVAEEISGVSAEEALGKPFRKVLKLVREADRKDNYAFVEKAMKNGEISHITNHTLLIAKDGREVSIADSAAPIKTADGKVTGCIVIFRDVTRERADERMKAEFVSLASHQLRTPLAELRWESDMLLSTDLTQLDKDQNEAIKDINNTTVRMTEIVNAILNISRIEGDQLTMKSKPTDLAEIVKTVVHALQPMVDEKKMHLTTVLTGLPKINTDPQMLTEVLSNLVGNAVKYTPPNGHVELKMVKRKTDIVVTVKDDGYGIPKSQQHLLFKKFFRGENVVKRETNGTGLGLYIVQRLVTLLGGEISVSSKEDHGTTFTFNIPVSPFH